ncbi:MAG: Ysc84 actin-binding domain protein [Planctomycetaceae bacterium]|nr:Ysc84 actin-binding domain protein [Planctomycetaceae bacterium]MBP62854.1 Ysc84 actin-binding domain protein [Planctomycetaceae bacterium]
MVPRTRLLLLLCWIFIVIPSYPVSAQTREDAVVNRATGVLDEIMALPTRQIPQALLQDAQGIAIVPGVVKGGFVVGVRYGKGVVLIRDELANWQAPQFVSLTGGSVGWQVGIQSTDVILVFKNRKSIDGLMNGKITIGVDVAAAAGPVGRQAAAATDPRLNAGIFSYSRSRGLFAGVSLDGSVLRVDQLATAEYYRGPGQSSGPAVVPVSTIQLIDRLRQYSRTTNAMTTIMPDSGWQAQTQLDSQQKVQRALSIRRQVLVSWQQLSSLLDDRWTVYLSPPSEVLNSEEVTDIRALQQTIQNYAVVRSDPRYAVLTSHPELATTHQLLQEYAVLQSSQAERQLVLPPPPGTGGEERINRF